MDSCSNNMLNPLFGSWGYYDLRPYRQGIFRGEYFIGRVGGTGSLGL